MTDARDIFPDLFDDFDFDDRPLDSINPSESKKWLDIADRILTDDAEYVPDRVMLLSENNRYERVDTMKLRRIWMLPVLLLLAVGLVGCGQSPPPVVNKPVVNKPVLRVDGPSPTVPAITGNLEGTFKVRISESKTYGGTRSWEAIEFHPGYIVVKSKGGKGGQVFFPESLLSFTWKQKD